MIGRIVISDVSPVVSAGQWPAKAVVDELIPVSATVFREGHDLVGANVVVTDPAGREGAVPADDVRRRGHRPVRGDDQLPRARRLVLPDRGLGRPGRHLAARREVKAEAGQGVDELAVDLEDGARLLERALPGVDPVHQPALTHAIQTLRNDALTDVADRLAPIMATEPRRGPRGEPAA